MIDLIRTGLSWLIAAPDEFWYWLLFGTVCGYCIDATYRFVSSGNPPEYVEYLIDRLGVVVRTTVAVVVTCCLSFPVIAWLIVIINLFKGVDWQYTALNLLGHPLGLLLYALVADPFGLVARAREPRKLGILRVKRS